MLHHEPGTQAVGSLVTPLAPTSLLVQVQQIRQRQEEQERIQQSQQAQQRLQQMRKQQLRSQRLSSQLTPDEQFREDLQSQHIMEQLLKGSRTAGKGERGKGSAATSHTHHQVPPAQQRQGFLASMYSAAQNAQGRSAVERMEHPCMHVTWSTPSSLSADMVAGLAAAACLVGSG